MLAAAAAEKFLSTVSGTETMKKVWFSSISIQISTRCGSFHLFCHCFSTLKRLFYWATGMVTLSS
jgi:hypothetical protein